MILCVRVSLVPVCYGWSRVSMCNRPGSVWFSLSLGCFCVFLFGSVSWSSIMPVSVCFGVVMFAVIVSGVYVCVCVCRVARVLCGVSCRCPRLFLCCVSAMFLHTSLVACVLRHDALYMLAFMFC